MMLPMSAPSHCSLMQPAAERLRERLAAIAIARAARAGGPQRATWRPSTIPTRIRQALVEQLYHPVRWIETVQFLAGAGRHAHRGVRAGQGARRARASASSTASKPSPSPIRRRSPPPLARGTTHAERTSRHRHRGLARHRRGDRARRSRGPAPRSIGTVHLGEGRGAHLAAPSPRPAARAAGRVLDVRDAAACAAFVDKVQEEFGAVGDPREQRRASPATTCSRA